MDQPGAEELRSVCLALHKTPAEVRAMPLADVQLIVGPDSGK